MDRNKLFDRVQDPHMRAVHSAIKPQCYVECLPDSNGDIQGGTVTKVIRDRYGIPVCVQVDFSADGSEIKKYDYISMDRIWLFEPYDERLPDESEFISDKEMEETMKSWGVLF